MHLSPWIVGGELSEMWLRGSTMKRVETEQLALSHRIRQNLKDLVHCRIGWRANENTTVVESE